MVIVGGIALAGTFSGGGEHPGPLAGSSSATSAAPQTSSAGSHGLDGSATNEPTAQPTTSHSADGQSSGAASGPSELCRQYLEFIARPESRSDLAAESGNFQQLSNLAGGAWHILGYCMELQPWAQKGSESLSGGLGFPPPGSQGQDRLGQPDAGGGNDNGQSGNGPGLGNQN